MLGKSLQMSHILQYFNRNKGTSWIKCTSVKMGQIVSSLWSKPSILSVFHSEYKPKCTQWSHSPLQDGTPRPVHSKCLLPTPNSFSCHHSGLLICLQMYKTSTWPVPLPGILFLYITPSSPSNLCWCLTFSIRLSWKLMTLFKTAT